MMYECGGCGNLARLTGCESNRVVQNCPVCGEATTWRVAFEAEGVDL